MTEKIVDILIIGAGASGAATAWSLSKSNCSIMCLEQGNRIEDFDYPSTKRNWEVLKQNEYHVSPNVRKLKSDYPINDKDSALTPVLLVIRERIHFIQTLIPYKQFRIGR